MFLCMSYWLLADNKSIIEVINLNSFLSWIRIIELIKIWFSLGSSSPIYSVTGGTIPITCELFIAIQQLTYHC